MVVLYTCSEFGSHRNNIFYNVKVPLGNQSLEIAQSHQRISMSGQGDILYNLWLYFPVLHHHLVLPS